MKNNLSLKLFLTLSIITICLASCKPNNQEYDWGLLLQVINANSKSDVLRDNGNGTVYVGSQNLTWAKCSQVDLTGANMYNSVADDCSGGSAGLFEYCTVNDNSCDDGTILNGTGSSEAWSTCANLTISGRTWRVPTKAELEALKDVATSTLFPGIINHPYWSSTSVQEAYASVLEFKSLISDTGTGSTSYSFPDKTSSNYVHCVSSGS